MNRFHLNLPLNPLECFSLASGRNAIRYALNGLNTYPSIQTLLTCYISHVITYVRKYGNLVVLCENYHPFILITELYAMRNVLIIDKYASSTIVYCFYWCVLVM